MEELKKEHLENVIKKAGFIKLPLSFDAIANNYAKYSYEINDKNCDTMLFDDDIYYICGFFSDTSNFYAFYFNTVCDAMQCPTIMTLDKNGNKIDRKIIVAETGCYGTPIDATSCYDSVWIHSDLTFESESMVIGKLFNDSTNLDEDICNTEKLEGFIDKKGKIHIKESGVKLCN